MLQETTFAMSGVRTHRPMWDEIDRHLRAIAARRIGLDLEEARWLVAARRAEVHRHLGHARLEDYLEHALGYTPHTAAERIRVAVALDELPETREAFAAGELTYSAVRELSRVMTEDTESAWLERARGRTMREIEPLVAGRAKGDLPDDLPDPGAIRQVVRFEVSGETLALLRDAQLALAEMTGERVDNDALLATLCRAVLDGHAADDRPSVARHQIALTVCERCDRGWQDGAGTPIEVAPEVIERARCDAQQIGRLDAEHPARATQEIPPSVRRLVWRRDHRRCVVPGCRSTRFLDVHHVIYRDHGGDHGVDNLCLLCDGHHRALHRGQLVIHGRAPRLSFAHADGRAYGGAPSDTMLEDAVAALRGTGFSAAESRVAAVAARSHVGAGAPLEDLIRAAFQELRPPSPS